MRNKDMPGTRYGRAFKNPLDNDALWIIKISGTHLDCWETMCERLRCHGDGIKRHLNRISHVLGKHTQSK